MGLSNSNAIFLFLLLVLLAGCSHKGAGGACTPGWGCRDNLTRAYLRADCSWGNDTPCAGGCDAGQCMQSLSEISGRSGDTEIEVSPALDGTIGGIVTLEAVSVPEGTRVVAFAIDGGDLPPMSETAPNLGLDTNGGDGWTYVLDATNYRSNTVYTLYALAFSGNIEPGVPPLGEVSVPAKIEN